MNEHTQLREHAVVIKRSKEPRLERKKEPTSRPGAHTASEELRELEPENWLLGDRFND